MKRILCLALALILTLPALLLMSSGAEEYIIVSDKYVSAQKLYNLNSKAGNIAGTYGFSPYFIMNDEVSKKGAYNYACDFYNSKVKKSGMVFCVDSENGECYIYGGEEYKKDELNVFLKAYTGVGEGTYYDRINAYLTKAEEEAKRRSKGGKSEENPESLRLMPRFMDNACVIDDGRENGIYTDIDYLSEEKMLDIVYVTYDDEKNPEEYAEKFYTENDFGFGKEKTGIILAASSRIKALTVKAYGRAEEFFTKSVTEKLMNELSGFIKKDDYIGLFVCYIESVDEIYSAPEEKESTTEETFPDDIPLLPDGYGEDGEEIPRLFDSADVISEAKEREVCAILDEVSAETKLDFVMLTVYTIPGSLTAKEYAEKYFERFGFGQGNKKSGVLLLIAFDPECCFLTSFGDASFWFSDGDLKKYTSSFYTMYTKENYDGVAETFALEAPQRLLRERLEIPVAAAVILVAAALIITAAIIISKRKSSSGKEEDVLTADK